MWLVLHGHVVGEACARTIWALAEDAKSRELRQMITLQSAQLRARLSHSSAFRPFPASVQANAAGKLGGIYLGVASKIILILDLFLISI